MLTKYAFFSGSVKAGCETNMRAYVESTLKPLWEQFQPSERVQVLYEHSQDKDGPSIPLVLAVTYRDTAAMEQAMQTDARFEARELLPAFYEQFFNEVVLWHYVFEH